MRELRVNSAVRIGSRDFGGSASRIYLVRDGHETAFKIKHT